MNRCFSLPTRRTLIPLLLGSLLALMPLAASAQTVGRPIPPTAQRGILVVTQPPNVVLNGNPDRLSPGARIRGSNNLLVLSGNLVGQTLLVRFTREPQGQVHEVWILTETEALQPVPQPPQPS